ncbi:kinase-like protein [Aspergillus sclerotioniger CBS 115572]|uniref:non-specific serine/threonine protein kinase n=1 Tax=Aspergillus sclerotioniger CBS 115572 TaxID=1450535 RepID=A0A317WST1_9EURO|nr:kinase-like protein [Aspergillus sclerotioniger CBS 115572]PWY88821.1 kinase-like protein [Aspergillus sclerotioniger CBS 115572]
MPLMPGSPTWLTPCFAKSHHQPIFIMAWYSNIATMRAIPSSSSLGLLSRPSPIRRVTHPPHNSLTRLRLTASYSSTTTTTAPPKAYSPKYYWIDGAEDLERYEPGGYHPIKINDVLHNRYHIVDKLGYGGYSTVWLARDTHLSRYVAVKVGIADSLPHETKALRALTAPGPSSTHPGFSSIPCPLDEFEVTGPNGTHPCYTVTPARRSLREASYSRLFPLDVARALSGGLVQAIAYIHSQGYIHGGQSRFEKWEERSDFFDESGRPKEGTEVWPPLDQEFEQGVRKYRQKQPGIEDFDDEETAAILDLMRRMLKFRPEERLTIEEVMQSEWMVKWVMPDYERSLQTQKE